MLRIKERPNPIKSDPIPCPTLRLVFTEECYQKVKLSHEQRAGRLCVKFHGEFSEGFDKKKVKIFFVFMLLVRTGSVLVNPWSGSEFFEFETARLNYRN